jgi:hypothetical protein
MRIDLNYYKTRKALDPNWNGYITAGHDIEDDDCDPVDANLITSLHRDSDRHSIVLDLDYGAFVAVPLMGRGHLRIKMKHPVWFNNDEPLRRNLVDCGITREVNGALIHRGSDGHGWIDLFTENDYVLLDSSSPGHKHLIIAADIEWNTYVHLLDAMVVGGIIEQGYEKASIKRGFTAIRMPWIKKELENIQR